MFSILEKKFFRKYLYGWIERDHDSRFGSKFYLFKSSRVKIENALKSLLYKEYFDFRN